MAKRILIFDPTGNCRFAIDWRHNRNRLATVLESNMQKGDVAIEVTPADDDSLQDMMASVHRCEAQVKNGLIEDVFWFEVEPSGQVSARTRIKMPQQLHKEMAGKQFTLTVDGLIEHSRKVP